MGTSRGTAVGTVGVFLDDAENLAKTSGCSGLCVGLVVVALRCVVRWRMGCGSIARVCTVGCTSARRVLTVLLARQKLFKVDAL